MERNSIILSIISIIVSVGAVFVSIFSLKAQINTIVLLIGDR